MATRRSTRLRNQSVNGGEGCPSLSNGSSSRSASLGRNKARKSTAAKRKRKPKKSTPQVENSLEVIDISDIPPITRPVVPPPSRNRRPQVISLDVTFSESSEESDVEETSSPQSKISPKSPQKIVKVESHSNSQKNIKNGYCSDSDEDFVPDFCPAGKERNEAQSSRNESCTYDSDLESDIYKVNYEDEREKAFEEVTKEFQIMNEKNKMKKKQKDTLDLLCNSSINESLDIGDEKSDADDSIFLPLDASVNSEILDSVPVNNRKRGRRSVVRTSRKTKMAYESLRAFSERDKELKKEESNESLYEDDIIMMEGTDISIRICWGVAYTRHTLKKNDKLISLYQELAEKHNVSISKVLLSFKDHILSPDTKPSDLKLSIGDILDGAVIRKCLKNTDDSESKKEEKDSLSFKIQTSNRRDVHTISINKYDKMSVLMEKYAKLRNIPLDKLKFKFDGESLESSDTPTSLDLEGGECIDAFEL